MSLFETGTQSDPAGNFSTRQKQLEARRKLAQDLIAQSFNAPAGQMVGPVYVANNPWGNFAKALGGSYMNSQADKQEAELALQQRMAQNDFNTQFAKAKDTPTSPQFGVTEEGNALPDIPNGPTRREVLMQGDAKGLRTTLAREFMKADEDREFKSDEAAQVRFARAQEKEDQRQWQEQQDAKFKRTFEEQMKLKQAPTIHITNSGSPGQAFDGKPLTSAQEKAALELGGEFSTLNRLASTFKDDYSGDLRHTIQRQYGRTVGGLADKDTQAMTSWWKDQAMLDELPTRHALFGAALTATEQKAWKDASISPDLAPQVIKDRLATRQQIANDAAGRMRASAVAGGKSGKQFDAATGNLGKPTPAPAAGRTKISSKAEYDALPAGAKWEMPDGRKGTK